MSAEPTTSTPSSDSQTAGFPPVLLSDNAAKRILAVREKENNPNMMLRVTVLGGGCSGFQYNLSFTDQTAPDDVRFEKNGATLVTDTMSLQFLAGSMIDFEQTMVKSAFKIKNPNAASGCGCGKSFGV